MEVQERKFRRERVRRTGEARESESEFYTNCKSEPDCWKDPPVMEMSTMQLPATLVAGAEVAELFQGVVEETTPAQPRGPSCSVASPPVRRDIDPAQPRGPSCPVASPPVLRDGVPVKLRGLSCPVVPIHLAPRDALLSQSGGPSHPVTPTSAPLHDTGPPPSSSLSCPAASPPCSFLYPPSSSPWRVLGWTHECLRGCSNSTADEQQSIPGKRRDAGLRAGTAPGRTIYSWDSRGRRRDSSQRK